MKRGKVDNFTWLLMSLIGAGTLAIDGHEVTARADDGRSIDETRSNAADPAVRMPLERPGALCRQDIVEGVEVAPGASKPTALSVETGDAAGSVARQEKAEAFDAGFRHLSAPAENETGIPKTSQDSAVQAERSSVETPQRVTTHEVGFICEAESVIPPHGKGPDALSLQPQSQAKTGLSRTSQDPAVKIDLPSVEIPQRVTTHEVGFFCEAESVIPPHEKGTGALPPQPKTDSATGTLRALLQRVQREADDKRSREQSGTSPTKPVAIRETKTSPAPNGPASRDFEPGVAEGLTEILSENDRRTTKAPLSLNETGDDKTSSASAHVVSGPVSTVSGEDALDRRQSGQEIHAIDITRARELGRKLAEEAAKNLPRTVGFWIEEKDIGRVTAVVSSRGSEITVRFTTDSLETCKVLQASHTTLGQALAESGLALGGFSVSSHNTGEDRHQPRSRRGTGTRRASKELRVEGPAYMQASSSRTVDYIA